MDAVMFSLFVTTASLDEQMKSLLSRADSEKQNEKEAAQAVKLLVELVVKPLRTTLYVPQSKVLDWRHYMQRFLPDSSTDIRDENDAYEYCEILLEKVCALTLGSTLGAKSFWSTNPPPTSGAAAGRPRVSAPGPAHPPQRQGGTLMPALFLVLSEGSSKFGIS
jgi:hypothetical protein